MENNSDICGIVSSIVLDCFLVHHKNKNFGAYTQILDTIVLGKYIDTFSYCSPVAVRNDNEAYRHISYSPIYPKFKAPEAFRRNGFKNDSHDIAPTVLILALLSDSRAETLIKAGRTEHLKYFLDNSRAFDAC